MASTTFVPGVTGVVREPTTTFWVDEAVLVDVLLKLDWVVVPPAFCCSNRFYNVISQKLGEKPKQNMIAEFLSFSHSISTTSLQ